jgi:L-alanine-DL-glutamate epimerase-like enolase superfamily enzyme
VGLGREDRVRRDGVTDVIVKATTDDGLVGWGESCSGANVESVLEALKAMSPFVVYLASDESAVVTGGVFPIDSGYMAFKANLDLMGVASGKL